jgi:hypothetical protein
MAKSLTWLAACCSGSLAGIREASSHPAPNAITPAASGLPSVRRRTLSGAERAASAADEAVEAAAEAADEAAEAAVSPAAEALELMASPMPGEVEPAGW